MFHLKKFVGKWISFAVLTHFGNYQVAVAAHVVLFLNPFQPSVAFHIQISHLICSVNHMTGFYMKRNKVLKWVENFQLLWLLLW